MVSEARCHSAADHMTGGWSLLITVKQEVGAGEAKLKETTAGWTRKHEGSRKMRGTGRDRM